jgi:folate-binding protein YgfZ
MISDMRVLRRETGFALETEPQVAQMLAQRLDQSIFTERVAVAISGMGSATAAPGGEPPVTGVHAVAVCGPAARDELAAWLRDAGLAQLQVGRFVEAERGAERFVLLAHEDLGIPAVDAIGSEAACEALACDLRARGAATLGPMALEALRIEAGTPRFGADMTDDTIPLEAGIERRAISMTKGCYVGQEVIVRILHRGQGRVARRLVGLVFNGAEAPPPGTELTANDRPAGFVTSAAFSPALRRPVALAYVHRDFVQPGTSIGAGPSAVATVAPLPLAAG